MLILTVAAELGVAQGRAGDGSWTTAQKSQFEVWRSEIRRQLYVPERLPELEAKVWSSFRPVEGVVADRVTYRTADGMLVPAVVYRPEHVRGKLPGIVVVNGHGVDKFTWYAVYSGMLFAKAGAEVVTYDPIGEGERMANGDLMRGRATRFGTRRMGWMRRRSTRTGGGGWLG